METFTVQRAILPRHRYSYAEFLEAVTAAEHAAFLTAAKADVQLERFYELAKARGVVDFNDPATLAAAPYLVAVAVLTADRLAELTG